MNTTTFCNAPLASAMTPWFKTGVGCCLVQLGSAAILMGVALGTPPSNFTSPLTVAVPVVLVELAGLPALTMRPLEMQMITVKATTRMKHFVFIQPYLLPLSHVICFFL